MTIFFVLWTGIEAKIEIFQFNGIIILKLVTRVDNRESKSYLDWAQFCLFSLTTALFVSAYLF